MPCGTIQVNGPEETGTVEITQLNLSSSKPNTVSVQFTMDNTTGRVKNPVISISANGNVVKERGYQSNPGLTTKMVALEGVTDLSEGETTEVEVCVNIERVP